MQLRIAFVALISLEAIVHADPVASSIEAPPATALSQPEIAGLATAAVGLASLGVGVYYGRKSQTLADPSDTAWPTDASTTDPRGQRYEHLETGFAIAGGAALATGGMLILAGRLWRTHEHFAIAPTLSPSGGGGLAIAGGF